MAEEALLGPTIKLIYLVVGRADAHLSPVVFARNYENLLVGLARMEPRIMCVIGGLILCPEDSEQAKLNMSEINLALARLADKDPHWLYLNPNNSLGLGGQPQKRFFDKNSKVVKAGCRALAQALVAASKSARMIQNFAVLVPKSVI